MSRIGRLPIKIPTGVTVTVGAEFVEVKGARGSNRIPVPAGCSVAEANGEVSVTRAGDHRRERSIHGLARQLIANAINGVSGGFQRVLEINGVGYRAEAKGRNLLLSLGFSHPILFCLPEGVNVKVDRQVVLTLDAHDRDLLGRTAAQIRALRPPEPYKGKGIKYAEETIKKKAGKTGA